MVNILSFNLTGEMMNLVGSISERIAVLEMNQNQKRDLHLRRKARIQTVKATTAIENNTLSYRQVTDILDGKLVIGSADEIREIKNSFLAYDRISEYDPYKIESFLRAHYYITEKLIESAGKFRTADVGIIDKDRVIHLGARPQFIHGLIDDLFTWAENSDLHPLIISAIVHFEIETIHPFADGNGRIGRLWQMLILYKWKPSFEFIPVETIIHKHQEEYYQALEESRKEKCSDKFILFSLLAIKEALDGLAILELTDIFTDKVTDKLSPTEKSVLQALVNYLLTNGTVNNAKAQEVTGKGPESVKKYLQRFCSMQILIAEGNNKGRNYRLNDSILKEGVK